MNLIEKIKLRNNYTPTIILLLSFLNSCFFAFVFNNPIVADAHQYDQIALNITKGYYSLDDLEPYTPTMLREPLYPFFLSIIYKVFGHHYNIVYIFQICLFSLTCLFTYIISKSIFDYKVATLSGILISIFPTLANYPSYILTETLFSFLLILSIFLLLKSFKLKKTSIFFYSGISLGLVSLTKAVGLLFILFVIISMIISYNKLRKNFFLNIFILIIGFTTIILPWSIRNYKTFDTFQISLRGSGNLWMAANQLDYSKDQIIQSIVYNFSETIGFKLFPNAVKAKRQFILLRANNVSKRMEQLKHLGYSTTSIEKQLQVEALEKIFNKPIIYTLQRFLEFEKMLAFSYIPSLNQPHIEDYFYKYNNGDIVLTILKAPFRLSGYLIFCLTVYGIIITRHKFSQYLFLVLIIIYINLIYSLLFGLGRYAVPLIPYYLIFTSCALTYGFNFFNIKINTKKI